MAKVILTPMIGEIRPDLLNSLTGCHALFERAERREFEAGGSNLGHAFQELARRHLLTNDARHDVLNRGEVTFLVTIKL